ncbi:hypothetical protein [Brumimicrobium sp.]
MAMPLHSMYSLHLVWENEFELACNYAKSTVPEVPIFSVEAYLDMENI